MFGKLDKDPTNKFQQNVIKVIKNCPTILDKYWAYHGKVMCPQAPSFFGLIKLHKDDLPIRPVVSYNNAPASKIAKFLNNHLRNVTNFNPSFSVKNSLHLIDSLKNLTIPYNAKLVSFDVKNLFTNIPVEEVTEIIERTLITNKTPPAVIIETLDLLKTCTDQNYFKFGESFFLQQTGLPMGSLLSPLLAEIFMNSFESNFLKTQNQFTKNILIWRRYVDDVLAIWTGSTRQLNAFLKFLNSIHPKIQFTMEIQSDEASINFLDLTISITNNALNFNIFRKPTHTDTVIPASSNHPHKHKHAAFHSMIHRLLHVPLTPTNFNLELNTIKLIATRNGYKPNLIDSILKHHRSKLNYSTIFKPAPDNLNKSYFRIQYMGKQSLEIANVIKETTEKTPAFYNKYNLNSLLSNNKTRKDPLLSSGVYKLNCNSCSSVYIGQTGRSFKTRINEHKLGIGKENTTSNFAQHINSSNHSFDPKTNTKILHKNINKGSKLDFLEQVEIKKALENNIPIVNDILFQNYSPLVKLGSHIVENQSEHRQTRSSNQNTATPQPVFV